MQHLCRFPQVGLLTLSGSYAYSSSPGKVLRVDRIKPHAPLLVRVPVNSFEFQPCDRTPQAGYLTR